jgi:hypothetical protein
MSNSIKMSLTTSYGTIEDIYINARNSTLQNWFTDLDKIIIFVDHLKVILKFPMREDTILKFEANYGFTKRKLLSDIHASYTSLYLLGNYFSSTQNNLVINGLLFDPKQRVVYVSVS